MRVDIWSDIACPWCYVGKRRFEAAIAGLGVEVEVTWRSFELDPHAPAAADEGAQDELLARKYGLSLERARELIAHMTATGAAEGIEFRFDRVRRGNTFDAHRLIHMVSRVGLGDAMKERLLRAYFTEGAWVADHETLATLAAQVGLDRREVREMLAGDDFRADVRRDEGIAHQLGISGVPFFVVDQRLGVSGAQPADTMRRILEEALATSAADAPAGDACGPDGCSDESSLPVTVGSG